LGEGSFCWLQDDGWQLLLRRKPV